MNPVFSWGLEFIHGLQNLAGAAGDELGLIFTLLGNEEFYLLLLPFLVWCLEWVIGLRVAILFLLSVVLNTDIKELITQPRPYILEPGIALVDPAGEFVYGEGYGMPSGHAQFSITVWGALALWVRKGWFWLLAGLLVILIGFSRMVLGLHFPTQILAGWGMGLLVVFIYFRLAEPLQSWLGRQSLWRQLGLALAAPVALLLLHVESATVAACGVLLGLGLGLVFSHRYLSFKLVGTTWQLVGRYLTGMVVLLAIYFGLSMAFPGEGESLYVPLRFLRYALVGGWISFGAPWMFTKTGLTIAAAPAV